MRTQTLARRTPVCKVSSEKFLPEPSTQRCYPETLGQAAVETFRARYDRVVLAITLLATAAMAAAALLVWLQPVPLPVPIFRYGFSGLLLLILALTYLYSPTGFSVAPDGLRIHRPIGAHVLPLASLRAARRAAPGELCGLRTFGSGGLFGIFGWFYVRRYGHYRAYVTSRRDMVLVQAERVYLLSPERPDEFLRLLSQWVPGLPTAKA